MFGGETVVALVVAAGSSRRMGGVDKIFAPLAGAPLLARTVECFLVSTLVDRVVVVLRAECLEAGRRLAMERGWPAKVAFCRGGERRQDSVRMGLEEAGEAAWVLIHDGARPLVTPELIARGLAAARATGAAVPGLPLSDTIKMVSPAGLVERTLPRQQLRAVQTPQVFRLERIRQAHRQLAGNGEFTDDAALLEALEHSVAVFPGDPYNLKVTTPEDLRWAETLWEILGRGSP